MAANPSGYVEITPEESTVVEDIIFEAKTCYLPTVLQPRVQEFIDFHVREDDVWIITIGKCGTTWTQEMCWLILNDFDFERAKSTHLEERSPYLEYNSVAPASSLNTFKLLRNMKGPRLIKTHLPFQFLPKQLWKKNAKIIFVCRDPRDMTISLYHHFTNWYNMNVSLDEFLNQSFVEPMQKSYWQNILNFWKIRHLPNVWFLTYEEMKQDLKGVVEKMCQFLHKTITDEQMTRILDHLSFESMQKNDTCNHKIEEKDLRENWNNPDFRFVRNGKIGSHMEELSEKSKKFFDQWILENTKDTDFNLYIST